MARAEITVAELREAMRRLLDAVEWRFGPRVQLGADEYLGLFAPEMFEPQPPVVLWRSLADDVHEIRHMLSRADASEDELLLWHDMNHLVGILQRLSSLTGQTPLAWASVPE
jgi:hypothetical protein